jgi:hypothetical protein
MKKYAARLLWIYSLVDLTHFSAGIGKVIYGYLY